MTEKKHIKESECKILIYLSVVSPDRKHVTAISNKLNIDYAYLMRILQAMVAKGWLWKQQSRRHMFYNLTPKAPLEEAKIAYNSDVLQKTLYADSYDKEEPKVILDVHKGETDEQTQEPTEEL